MRLTVPPLTWLASFGCIIRAVVKEIVAFELRPQYAWSHHSEIELQSAADFVSQSVMRCEFRSSSLPTFDLHITTTTGERMQKHVGLGRLRGHADISPVHVITLEISETVRADHGKTCTPRLLRQRQMKRTHLLMLLSCGACI